VFFKESDNLIFVDADPKLGVSITLELRDLLLEGSVPHHAANMFAILRSPKPCSKRREDQDGRDDLVMFGEVLHWKILAFARWQTNVTLDNCSNQAITLRTPVPGILSVIRMFRQ
jgi:hypothetical protein